MSKTNLVLLAVFLLLLAAYAWFVLTRPLVKGNGESMIYHLSGCPSYGAAKIGNHPKDAWFLNEKDAASAGFRKAANCK